MTNIRRIVVIGASSPEGQGDPEGGGYVGRLSRWFLSGAAATGEARHVYNLGVSGDYLSGIAQRMQEEVPRRRPHLIVVQVGVNDVLRTPDITSPCHTTLDDFRQQLSDMLKIAQHQAPVIVVGMQAINEAHTQPVGWGPIFYRQADINTYCPLIVQAAKEFNMPYVSISEAWSALGADEYQKLLADDGLHPNPTGHQWIFEQIKAVIEREIGE